MWSSFHWDVCTYSIPNENWNGEREIDHKLKMNSLCDMFMHMEKQTKQKR